MSCSPLWLLLAFKFYLLDLNNRKCREEKCERLSKFSTYFVGTVYDGRLLPK